MTILAIPFTSLALVAHAAGGAILTNAGAYVAGTYVPAAVVQAFGSATAALGSMGTAAAGLASANPVTISVVAVVAVTAAAVGTYCYFHGIPAPVAETLVHAGLASPSQKGLAILVPKLAAALVLLGAAGYVAYRFYENFNDLWADRETSSGWAKANESTAQTEAERNFGGEVWKTLGAAVWATKADIAEGLAKVAQQALDGAARAADAVSDGASAAYGTAASGGTQAAVKGKSMLEAVLAWISERWPLRDTPT